MGFMDSMKSRLGFGGGNQDWDDDEYDDYDDGYEDDYVDDEADEYVDDENADELDPGRYQPGSMRENSVRLVTHDARSGYGSGQRQRRYEDRTSGYDLQDNDIQSRDTSEPEFLKNRGSAPATDVDAMRRQNYGVSEPKSTFGSGATSRQSAESSRTNASRTNANRHHEPASAESGSGYMSGVDSVSGNYSDLMILSPSSYNEAQAIAQTLKRGQTMVLSLKNTRSELAKRILDFSFGVASALGGRVEKIDDKVFLITHNPSGLTDKERRQLVDAGIIR